jgi:hypothetical protein
MGIRSVERLLEQGVEGGFNRLFRSGVRPVEIGKRLVRAMDDNRSIGVDGRAIVPNEFTIQLSEADNEQLSQMAESLRGELAEAVREHAAEEGCGFAGPVGVTLSVHDKLKKGSFRIDAHIVESAGGAAVGSLLLPTHERLVLGEYVVSFGRLDECTITLGDPNASRRHAEIRPQHNAFVIKDLASTNGTLVNGVPITEHRLGDGDRVRIGNTEFVFNAS